MNDETAFDTLKDAVPTAKRHAQHRDAFLARAASMRDESELPAIRHNGVSGGAAARIGYDETKGIPMTTMKPRRLSYALRLTAVALIGFAAAFAASPDLRSLAQQLIQYFTRSADVAPSYVTIGGGEPAPSVVNPASFNTAITAAAYDARVPAAMPPAYQPYGGTYVPAAQMVSLEYRCGPQWGLSLEQLPHDPAMTALSDVGDSATIVDVSINGQPGQYVKGMWTYDMPAEYGPEGPRRNVPTTRRWRSDVEFHTLVWASNGMTYRLVTSSGSISNDVPLGACALDRNILVTIAESVR